MRFELDIPRGDKEGIEIQLDAGEILFVLGANGTGKSSLMHRFHNMYPQNTRRVTAHRQTWLDSNAIDLSAASRVGAEVNFQHGDVNPEARWKDNYGPVRSLIALYDLIDAENVRARKITKTLEEGNDQLVKEMINKDSPIKIVNEIFRSSNLPMQISVKDDGSLVSSKYNGTPYSIAELSDGERNALLLAANVLTVKSGTLILIDEPERHLHRSIIVPLLTLLFSKKTDCSFVISTHEISLPLDSSASRVLLLRDCTYSDRKVIAWEADELSLEAQIDDGVKKDIMGARRKVLFIEGTKSSLDKPLYSLIFPNVSIVVKSTCRDVEHAVAGIREADGLHWVHAFGIVDNDRRSGADIDNLKAKGVYALSVLSVESIYYHPEIQRYLAERHANIIGGDPAARLENAINASIESIKPHARRLSARAVEKAVREEMFRRLPKADQLIDSPSISMNIDVPAIVKKEQERLQKALDEKDFATIVKYYPIRETSAPNLIADRLGFANRTQYQGAVLKLMSDDVTALDFAKSLFGTLVADISAT